MKLYMYDQQSHCTYLFATVAESADEALRIFQKVYDQKNAEWPCGHHDADPMTLDAKYIREYPAGSVYCEWQS